VLTGRQLRNHSVGLRLPRIHAGAFDDEQLLLRDQEAIDEHIQGVATDQINLDARLADHGFTRLGDDGLDLRRPPDAGPVRGAEYNAERHHDDER